MIFSWWRERQRRRLLREAPVPEVLWRGTIGRLQVLRRLRAGELENLRRLATLFLREKEFFDPEEMGLTEAMRLEISVLAVLPALHLGYEWLDGWSSVIVYPGEFRTGREIYHETGLVEQDRRPLSGEASYEAGLVLSWTSVDSGNRDSSDGDNVVIHEIAHKLDMRNGAANGNPPLHAGMSQRRWTQVMQAAFDDLNRLWEARGDTPIDPYAATDPAEFFAVTSEYHFEAPQVLEAAYPEVSEQLGLFYRPPLSTEP